MNAYSMTAICPFLTNLAPMVFTAEMVLSVVIRETCAKTYVTVDGQEFFKLQGGDKLRIYGLPDGIVLARFGVSDYFSKLRFSGFVKDSPGSVRSEET
jgi:NAD kinase